MTRWTITTAYPDTFTPDAAIAEATTAASACDVPCTIVPGTGYHPTWGQEPVLVVTVVTGLAGDPYVDVDVLRFALTLCDWFDQDCVLVETDGPGGYVAWLKSRPDKEDK